MNKLFYLICLLWIPLGFINGQNPDDINNRLQSSIEQKSVLAFSKVFRSQEGTYVKLKWDQNVEKSSYTVILKDQNGNESTFKSTGTSITIKHLEVPQIYTWTVVELENEEIFKEQFSTAYNDISVSWELSSLLSKWKGNVKAGTNLETFLRESGKDIDPEELETFIYNFYEGTPPSILGGAKATDCRCTMVASDDFVLGGENFANLNHGHTSVYCGWWWRENSYAKSKGASKQASLSLRGRLKDNQTKSYTADDATATTAKVHYICDGEDCCGANIDYGLRYDTEVYASGAYNSKGSYGTLAADMGFFSEIKSDGTITLLGSPVAAAVEMHESRVNNPEFWSEIVDLVVPTTTLVLGILALDPVTAAGLLTLTGGLETLIDEVKDLIGMSPIKHASSGNNFAHKEGQVIGQTYFTPNEWRLYTIVTGSAVKFEDAWGKKLRCGKGYINTDASLSSGMAMAFALKDENNNFPSNCCVDEKAKWLSNSYMGAGDSADLLAFCGLVIGCNGIFDGRDWVHENGFDLDCISDNPVLVTASGTAKVEADCCPGGGSGNGGGIFVGGLDVTYDCISADGNDTNCVSCLEPEGQFIFELDFSQDDETIHNIQLVKTTELEQVVVYEQNNVTENYFAVMLPLEECSNYTAYHTTIGACGSTTKGQPVVESCCNHPGTTGEPAGDYYHHGMSASDDQLIQNRYLKTMSIFPNPARNELSLSIENSNLKLAEHLAIFTVEGKMVYSTQLDIGTTKATIDISNLQNGLYFISIQSGDDAPVTKRLVIQK